MKKLFRAVEDFALEKEDSRREERLKLKGTRSAFWASEASVRKLGMIWGRCHRSLWWEFHNVPYSNVMDARALRTILSGREFEIRMNEDLKEMGLWDVRMNAKKKFFNEELNVSAEADAFIRWEGSVIGLEYKTCYGYWSRKEIFIKRRPKIEALLQCMIYIYHFKLPWKLIYCTRDSQEMTEFNLTLDEHDLLKIDGKDFWLGPLAIDSIKNRLNEFQACLDTKEIPARDFPILGYSKDELEGLDKLNLLTKTEKLAMKAGQKLVKIPWMCSYCRYFFRCQREAAKEIGKSIEENLIVPMAKVEEQLASDEEEFTI